MPPRQLQCVAADDDGPGGDAASALAQANLHLPEDLIARSEVLRTATFATADGVAMMALPQGIDSSCIDAWAELVASAPGPQDMTAQRAIRGILAADVFSDEEAVTGFCVLLAEHMFNTPPQTRHSKHAEKAIEDDGSCEHRTGLINAMAARDARRRANDTILNQLPQELAVRTLAEVALPPCARYLSCDSLRIALEAHNPAGVSLQQHQLSVATTNMNSYAILIPDERINILQSTATLPHVTSLCIGVSLCTHRHLDDRNSLDSVQSAFQNMLSSFSSLRALHLTGGVNQVALEAFSQTLPGLTALQSLQISGGQYQSESVDPLDLFCVVQALGKVSTMTELRFYDFLINYGCVDDTYDDIAKVFDALGHLTSLRCLNLTRCIAQKPRSSACSVRKENRGHIKGRSVMYIAQALKVSLGKLVGLEKLVLDHTIVDYGVGRALGGLRDLTSLTMLSVSATHKGSSGAPRNAYAAEINELDEGNGMVDLDGIEEDQESAWVKETAIKKSLSIDVLADSLQNLQQLRSLDVDGYELSTVEIARDVANTICGLTNLTRLQWGGPKSDREMSTTDLLQLLRSDDFNDGELPLKRNAREMGEFVRVFSARCGNLAALHSLAFMIECSTEHLRLLAGELVKLRHVRELIFCGFRSVGSAVSTRVASVHVPHACNEEAKERPGDVVLAEALESLPVLTKLDFSRGNVSGRELFMTALEGSLASMKQLRELRFPRGLTQGEAAGVEDALQECFGAGWASIVSMSVAT